MSTQAVKAEIINNVMVAMSYYPAADRINDAGTGNAAGTGQG